MKLLLNVDDVDVGVDVDVVIGVHLHKIIIEKINLRKDDEYNLNLRKDDESAAFVFNAIANARPPLLSPIKY